MESIDLTLQPGGRADDLNVFLISPAGNQAFRVSIPEQLSQLHQAWLRRFLVHHDPGGPDVPAAVVLEYGSRLTAAMQAWLQRQEWAALQRELEQRPLLPLRLRCQGTMPLIERLPWEALPLERPIWRLDGPAAIDTSPPPRRGLRSPRLLLLVGREAGLHLDQEIAALEQLARQGRISLHTLRGEEHSNLCGLRAALRDRDAWDVLVFLGHSAGDPQGGGRLQLGDGHWLGGHLLRQELQQAANAKPSLVLLNSCAGMDLARCCIEAGIPWALCFREAVPTTAASLAFTELLEGMEQGLAFNAAIEQVRRTLAERGPAGSQLLLSAMGAGNAVELVLPLSLRRRFRLRLASTQPRQLMAAALLLALALPAELWPANLLSSYLLDRRLDLQRLWRQATDQPGPQVPPLAVLLLNEGRTYPALAVEPTPGRVARAALAEVLRRTPVEQVPLVGLDVVLDEAAAPATEQLAAVIRQQKRRVVAGWLCPDAGAALKAGEQSRPLPLLQDAGLESRNLCIGIPAGSGELHPAPLRILEPVSGDHFAAAFTSRPNRFLPADAVIDWSVDWQPSIRIVSPAELPLLRARALLVGTDGTIDREQRDLFSAPGAIRGALPRWGGSSDAMPGVLVQAVIAQSITAGHWLISFPLPLAVAMASGLGVLLAAGAEQRRLQLGWLAAIALISVPISLQLATSQRLLVPVLLPLAALSTTCLLRRD